MNESNVKQSKLFLLCLFLALRKSFFYFLICFAVEKVCFELFFTLYWFNQLVISCANLILGCRFQHLGKEGARRWFYWTGVRNSFRDNPANWSINFQNKVEEFLPEPVEEESIKANQCRGGNFSEQEKSEGEMCDAALVMKLLSMWTAAEDGGRD